MNQSRSSIYKFKPITEKEMKLIEENMMTDLNNILSTMLTEEFSFAVMDLERNKTVLKDAVCLKLKVL